MSKQSISNAAHMFSGKGRYAPLFKHNERVGSCINPIIKVDLGVPIAEDADAFIVGATSTELPDTETVTYAFPEDGGTSPVDGANQSGVLDVPRNMMMLISHASSIVDMTVLMTGKDEYDEDMSELFTVSGGGTAIFFVGNKAFKKVTSIAFTSAANAEANTISLGFGHWLGLPLNLEGTHDVLAFYADNNEESGAAHFPAGDPSVATPSTNDVRGLAHPETTVPNGAIHYWLWMKVKGVNAKEDLVGVNQA